MASKLVLLAVLVVCVHGNHYLTRKHIRNDSLPEGCHWVCDGGETTTSFSVSTNSGLSTSSPEITSPGGENSSSTSSPGSSALTTLETNSTSSEGNTTQTGENSTSTTEGSSTSPGEITSSTTEGTSTSPGEITSSTSSSEPPSTIDDHPGGTKLPPGFCWCRCPTTKPGDDRRHNRNHRLYHGGEHLRHLSPGQKHHGRPETKHHGDQNKNHEQQRYHHV